MTEKSPGDQDASQPIPEHGELESFEVRRQAIVSQLRTLMEEEQKLIAGPDAKASFDRLSEINREEAILIDQLGAIEREIASQQGSM